MEQAHSRAPLNHTLNGKMTVLDIVLGMFSMVKHSSSSRSQTLIQLQAIHVNLETQLAIVRKTYE